MTAIAAGAKRARRLFRATSIELAATASVEYKQGALIGFNTATGLLVVGQALTTFIPIGLVAESKTLGAGGGTVLVDLFRELTAVWMLNDATDAVVATDVGGLAYVLDDQTVKRDDDTNTLSVLGRIWKIDSRKGVLVEPIFPSADPNLSGLDG